MGHHAKDVEVRAAQAEESMTVTICLSCRSLTGRVDFCEATEGRTNVSHGLHAGACEERYRAWWSGMADSPNVPALVAAGLVRDAREGA